MAAAYAATGILGLQLAALHPSVTLVWAPSGIAIAAVLLGGLRLVPGIALGAYIVNATTSAPPAFWIVTALGNPAGAIVGAYALQRVGFRPQLDRVRDVLALATVGALGGTAVSAAIGTLGMVQIGMAAPADAPSIFLEWWLGDGMGVLVIGALILTWGNGSPRFDRRREIEAVAAFAVATSAIAVVTRPDVHVASSTLVSAATVPLSLWTAFRFGPRGASFSSLMVSIAVLYGVSTGSSIFAHTSLATGLFIAWAYLTMATLALLVLSATVAQRDKTAADLGAVLGEVRRAGAANDELAAVVRSSNDIILSTGLDEIVRSWNGAAERAFGYSADEMIGQHVGKLQPLGHESVVAAVRDKVLRGETIESLEVSGYRKDGTLFDGEASFAPIRNAEGEIVGISCIGRDVSEARRLKERLHQAEKLEAVGTLAGGIAHDFNNLLWVILGNTERALLRLPKGGESDAIRGMMRDVVGATMRAKELVESILTFTRSQPRESELVSLGDLVRESIQTLRPTIAETIDVRTQVSEDGDTVLADASQLRQVLMNLFGNASAAIGDGPGSVEIQVGPLDVEDDDATGVPPGAYVVLSVRDTGCGMDEETQKRIFEPFFTTKNPSGGTGLGLAMVHRIVTSRGGLIRVSSAPGEGSIFRVFLPRADGVAVRSGGDAPVIRGGAGEPILVVDDEENVLTTLGGLLTELGYDVTTCHEPEAAIRLVKEEPSRFRLLITDQAMPGVTGSELIERVHEHAPGLPAILVSGFGPSLGASGVHTYLQKPVELAELARTVHGALHS